MKIIINTGPSGSGKTYLSNKLSILYDDTIVIKTDSYYRDNLLIKFLSFIKYDIYDRVISIKKNELKNTLESICNRDKYIIVNNYDFKQKKSSKKRIMLNYNNENQFIILEGIFSHRLNINYQETINIICNEKKEICFKRRLRRDILERGRNVIEVNNKFNKSWELFYKHNFNNIDKKKFISINTNENKPYEKLITFLNYIHLNKKTKKDN